MSYLGWRFFLQKGERLLKWPSFLAALLLTSSAFSIAAALINVSNYPFSLGWSEGNRIWDYSILFGSGLYDYPADSQIYSLTDVGRQLVGGFLFLFPGVTIFTERLWVGLTTVIPQVMLGLAAFRNEIKNKKLWLLLGLFAFIFLKQGPIHPPLVMCAFVVALIWRRPLWLAIPLIFVTGYLAEASRYTWLFAPAIWIVMLEFSGAMLENGQSSKIKLVAGGSFGIVWRSRWVLWICPCKLVAEHCSLMGRPIPLTRWCGQRFICSVVCFSPSTAMVPSFS